MFQKTVAELSQALSRKDISSLELTLLFLDRIKHHDSVLNTFITVSEEQAIEQAKKADQSIAEGVFSGLTGIPIALKDIFCTQGVKTSCASRMLDNFIAPYDAHVVEQLKEAGAVILGKTNMDEFAMGSSNENSYYGPVKNPWDTHCIPGGSSGGSAACVAARLAPAALGTDTGGSVRQPAALCGITGLKPTYGRVSRYGMIAFSSSLDQAGILAQTAEDVAILLNQIAVYDSRDSTCVDWDLPNYTKHLNQPISSLTIGLPEEYFNAQLNSEIAKCLEDAIEVFKGLGVRFKPIKLPHTHLSIPIYYVIAPAECSSNLSRYDGVRYGHRCQNPENLDDLYRRSRTEGFGEEVKRRIMIGTYVLSSAHYDSHYLKAQKVRNLIRADFEKAFEDVDLILGPTTPSSAFKIGEKVNDPVQMYLNDIYTVPANLAGLPGISLPAGFIENLPIGMQLIAPHFKESLLLNAAHMFQKETDWHQRIPELAKR
jgi:aspartyl-tRNA(Asn)/glutamyl-tRNA(Gln) amidotransferase subunit A